MSCACGDPAEVYHSHSLFLAFLVSYFELELRICLAAAALLEAPFLRLIRLEMRFEQRKEGRVVGSPLDMATQQFSTGKE